MTLDSSYLILLLIMGWVTYRVSRFILLDVLIKEPRKKLLDWLRSAKVDGEPGKAPRLLQPAQVAGRDVQLVEPVGDVGVVLEEAGDARLAVPPCPEKPSV